MTTYDDASVTYDSALYRYPGNLATSGVQKVQYRVQVFNFDGTSSFGIGSLIAEFENAKNLGYADYANDVPESFFTVNQDDPKLALVAGKEGRAHVRYLRNDEIIHAGFFGLETDETEDDVVFYNYGYAAAFFWLPTDWGTTWTGSNIGQIATDVWLRARTGLTNSNLGFVNTGQIQAPPTVKGGSTPIVMPSYPVYWKRILFVLRDLAALAASDIGNVTLFEITHSDKPVFNFWADRGVQAPNEVWEYGKNVVRFRSQKLPIFRRNELYAAGTTPHDVALRIDKSDATDIGTFGRRIEPIFFSWVRDNDEMTRAANIRFKKAMRTQVGVGLTFKRDSVIPFQSSSSPARIGDSAKVIINRGLTQINGYRQIVGAQTLVVDGHETVRAIVQELP